MEVGMKILNTVIVLVVSRLRFQCDARKNLLQTSRIHKKSHRLPFSKWKLKLTILTRPNNFHRPSRTCTPSRRYPSLSSFTIAVSTPRHQTNRFATASFFGPST